MDLSTSYMTLLFTFYVFFESGFELKPLKFIDFVYCVSSSTRGPGKGKTSHVLKDVAWNSPQIQLAKYRTIWEKIDSCIRP